VCGLFLADFIHMADDVCSSTELEGNLSLCIARKIMIGLYNIISWATHSLKRVTMTAKKSSPAPSVPYPLLTLKLLSKEVITRLLYIFHFDLKPYVPNFFSFPITKSTTLFLRPFFIHLFLSTNTPFFFNPAFPSTLVK
jgi:hypothetical protein